MAPEAGGDRTLGLERTLAVVDAVSIGVLVVDRDMVVRIWNRWMEDHSGLARDQVVGRSLDQVFPSTDLRVFRRRMRQALTLGSRAFFDARIDGPLLPLENEQRLNRRFRTMQQSCVLVPLPGEVRDDDLLCLSILDVTTVLSAELEVQEKAEELVHQSRHDDLTGVASRAWVLERLERELERHRRKPGRLGLLLLDLDHFKSVNDTYGHLVGDQVLVAAAQALEEGSRGDDLVGRYGGEEFVVMLPDLDLEAATRVAERMRRRLGEVRVETGSEDGPISVTASFGVVEAGPDETVDGLLGRADDLLYRAKRAGRDRVCGEG